MKKSIWVLVLMFLFSGCASQDLKLGMIET